VDRIATSRSPSRGRALAALVLAVVALLAGPARATHTSPQARQSAARALDWLRGQVSPDGSLAGSASLTAELVLAVEAAGQDANTFTTPSPVDYLRARAGAILGESVGVIGKVVLAVTAAGRDPTAFGGRDLVAAIRAKNRLGVYDPQLFNQAFAMMALAAAARPPGDLPFLQVLRAQQGSGGWGFAAGAPADTNSTAVAIQALLAARGPLASSPLRALAIARAVRYLHGQHNADAGFPFQRTSEFCTGPCPSDPNSTAYVIQALVAAGEGIDGPAWRKGGRTPVQALIAMQAPDGSFPGFSPILATVQAVPGILGKPFLCIAAGTGC
jgi:hypothetical protein